MDGKTILQPRCSLLGTSIKGVHHIAINVTDMKKSLKFYKDALGMKPLFEPQEGSGSDLEKAVKIPGAKLLFVMLQCGEDCVELIQYLNPRGSPYDRRNCDVGNTHLAFRVKNIDESYSELKGKGVRFNGPPVKIAAGPLKGRAFTYFTDPDGVTLEIFQDQEG
jgi:glyoxylase I family protein